jgi:hypothetical protein
VLDKHLENWCSFIATQPFIKIVGMIALIAIIGWVIFRWRSGVFLPKPKKDDG